MPRTSKNVTRVVPSQIVEFLDATFDSDCLRKTDERIEAWREFQLQALLWMLDQVPSELLPADRNEFSALIACRFSIQHMIQQWQRLGASYYQFNPVGREKANPLWVMRELLTKCPDSVPVPEIAGLDFVDDEALRNQLRIDMTEAFDAERNGDWKAATVLAGSVMEALLLWALGKSTREQINTAFPEATKGRLRDLHLNEWTLGPYIGAAHALGLIDDYTRHQAHLAQNFRNLIHAGRATRLGEQCNHGTSLGALAGMERVADALASGFPAAASHTS